MDDESTYVKDPDGAQTISDSHVIFHDEISTMIRIMNGISQ